MESSPGAHPSYRYRFGTVEFNEASFELRVAGVEVEVQRKPLSILALLLRRAGTVVSRADFRDEVWGGRVYEKNVLDNALKKLKAAIGEDNAARIVNRAGLGYCLSGTVDRLEVGPAAPVTKALDTGQPVPLRPSFILARLIARSPNSEVWLARHIDDPAEERVYKFGHHARELPALRREVFLNQVLLEEIPDPDSVVKILDWNLDSAPFFLEMAYAGEDLQVWSTRDQQLSRLTLDERIALFHPLVETVSAAHRAGVLHKDLKPQNVLIAGAGGQRRLQLTDFGSGRLLDRERDADEDLDLHDLSITQGRPRSESLDGISLLYVAPELLAGQRPTVQSDIYALGLMLYQVVVADLARPLAPGWERDVTDPCLIEDIEKATDGDPGRRFRSAADFAERLDRLAERRREREQLLRQSQLDEAMRAELGRNRALRPWRIGLVLTLSLGLVLTALLYRRELHTAALLQRSEQQATRNAERATAVAHFIGEEVLSSNDPFAGKADQNRTIRAALDQAATSLDGRFGADPETEASIRDSLASVYLRIAEAGPAEQQWHRVIELLQARRSADDPQLLASRYSLAQAESLSFHFDLARDELTTADRAAHIASAPASIVLLSQRSWGVFYFDQDRCDAAVPYMEKSVSILRAADPPDLPALDLERVALAQCYTGVSRFTDSERLGRELSAEVEQRTPHSDLTLALARYVLAESLSYQKRYADAEALFDQAYPVVRNELGPDNIRTLNVLNARCVMLSAANRMPPAVTCLQESYELTRRRYGDDSWLTWGALANLGVETFFLGHTADARHTLEQAYQGLARTLGPAKPLAELSAYYLARAMIKQHDSQRAEILFDSLRAADLGVAEPGAPWDQRLTLLHGLILYGEQRPREALPLLQQASDLTPTDDPDDTVISEAQATLRTLSRAGS